MQLEDEGGLSLSLLPLSLLLHCNARSDRTLLFLLLMLMLPVA